MWTGNFISNFYFITSVLSLFLKSKIKTIIFVDHPHGHVPSKNIKCFSQATTNWISQAFIKHLYVFHAKYWDYQIKKLVQQMSLPQGFTAGFSWEQNEEEAQYLLGRPSGRKWLGSLPLRPHSLAYWSAAVSSSPRPMRLWNRSLASLQSRQAQQRLITRLISNNPTLYLSPFSQKWSWKERRKSKEGKVLTLAGTHTQPILTRDEQYQRRRTGNHESPVGNQTQH